MNRRYVLRNKNCCATQKLFAMIGLSLKQQRPELGRPVIVGAPSRAISICRGFFVRALCRSMGGPGGRGCGPAGANYRSTNHSVVPPSLLVGWMADMQTASWSAWTAEHSIPQSVVGAMPQPQSPSESPTTKHRHTVQVVIPVGYRLPDDCTDLNLIQRYIAAQMGRTVEACLEIGRALHVLKAACQHGSS